MCEAVSVGVVEHAALVAQCAEGVTQGGGPHCAEFAQLLGGDGPVGLVHGLHDAFGGSEADGLRFAHGWRIGDIEGQRGRLSEQFHGDVLGGRGGAVFDRQVQMGAIAAQVEV